MTKEAGKAGHVHAPQIAKPRQLDVWNAGTGATSTIIASKRGYWRSPLNSKFKMGGERMIKILVPIAVFGSMVNFASLAMAQNKPGDTVGSDAAARKEAQCAHRRTMPPDPHDGCSNQRLRNVEMGYGQSGAVADGSQASGIGPGNGGGEGNGIGPANGGGQGRGKGR